MKNYRQILILLFSVWFLAGFTFFEPEDGNALLKDTKQDFLSYASPKTIDQPLVSKEEQFKLYQSYLNHYFSPWNDPTLIYGKNNITKIRQNTIQDIRKFSGDPGWGENKQRHPSSWMTAIAQNVDIKTYPNLTKDAITVQVTQLRVLPTNEPSFESITRPGGDYPFDQISVSLLPANLPIKVMQLTKDRAWAFVLTPYNAYGWIPFKDLAWVDKKFMQDWQNGNYSAVIKDKVSFINAEGNFLFFGRIGSLYPFVGENSGKYLLKAAVADIHHQAVIQEVLVAKSDLIKIPQLLTVKNLSNVANLILGLPYDWGGYYGHRDCSATLMDLFMSFGIWLPRNSSDQVHSVEFTSLGHLDVAAKKEYIEKHAVPFLTILWAPGHVTLYLNKKDAQSYMFQTVWGLPKQKLFEGGIRLPVGKTVITPVDFGEEYYLTTASFLSRIQGMGVIVKRSEVTESNHGKNK